MNQNALSVGIEPETASSDPASDTQNERPTCNNTLLLCKRNWKIAVLVVLLVLSTTVVIHRYLMDTAPPPLRIIFQEGPATLTESDAIRLLTELENRFDEQEEYLSAGMSEWQEAVIDDVRNSFLSVSNGFLDWYFSPIGSYTRLGATLWGNLDDLLKDQFDELITNKIDLDAQLESLLNEHSALARAAQQEWLNTTLSEQYQRVAQQTQVNSDEPNGTGYPVLDLGFAVNSAWANYSDNPRWSAAAGGGGAYAGIQLTHRLLQAPAMKGAQNTMRMLARRLGSHLGRSTALGLTTSAGSGPAAIATGPAVFVGSLAMAGGTEYGLLKLEERQHRPTMEQEIEEVWAEIEETLRNQFQEKLRTSAAGLQQQLQLAHEQQSSQLPLAYRILGS